MTSSVKWTPRWFPLLWVAIWITSMRVKRVGLLRLQNSSSRNIEWIVRTHPDMTDSWVPCQRLNSTLESHTCLRRTRHIKSKHIHKTPDFLLRFPISFCRLRLPKKKNSRINCPNTRDKKRCQIGPKPGPKAAACLVGIWWLQLRWSVRRGISDLFRQAWNLPKMINQAISERLPAQWHKDLGAFSSKILATYKTKTIK